MNVKLVFWRYFFLKSIQRAHMWLLTTQTNTQNRIWAFSWIHLLSLTLLPRTHRAAFLRRGTQSCQLNLQNQEHNGNMSGSRAKPLKSWESRRATSSKLLLFSTFHLCGLRRSSGGRTPPTNQQSSAFTEGELFEDTFPLRGKKTTNSSVLFTATHNLINSWQWVKSYKLRFWMHYPFKYQSLLIIFQCTSLISIYYSI